MFTNKQLTLFSDIEVLPETKRKRFPPVWKKFYTVYQFDYTLYHRICHDVVNKPCISRFVFYLRPMAAFLYAAYFAYLFSLSRFDEDKIRKLCFIYGEDGGKLHKGDETHIFRIAALQKVYNKLYEYAKLSPFATEDFVERVKNTAPEELSLMECSFLCKLEEFENRGFRIHFDDVFGHQLEIAGTELLSVRDRLKLHLKLLRRLKSAKEV